MRGKRERGKEGRRKYGRIWGDAREKRREEGRCKRQGCAKANAIGGYKRGRKKENKAEQTKRTHLRGDGREDAERVALLVTCQQLIDRWDLQLVEDLDQDWIMLDWGGKSRARTKRDDTEFPLNNAAAKTRTGPGIN